MYVKDFTLQEKQLFSSGDLSSGNFESRLLVQLVTGQRKDLNFRKPSKPVQKARRGYGGQKPRCRRKEVVAHSRLSTKKKSNLCWGCCYIFRPAQIRLFFQKQVHAGTESTVCYNPSIAILLSATSKFLAPVPP